MQPAIAALKSLALPGLGQWHNGQLNKAIWFFLSFALLSVPAVAVVALYLPPAWTAPALALGVLLALGLWLGAIVDAWRVAAAEPAPAASPSLYRLSGVTVLLIVLCDFVALPLLTNAVRAHQVEAFRIPSLSMTPTLWPGDFVFADKRYACIGCRAPVRRGDVAIFANPNDRTQLYVKRVIGLPGDHVQVEGNAVRVNGELLPEPTETFSEASPQPPLISRVSPPVDIVVPPGHVFALGDRRAHSLDSRQFGAVPLQDVVGRVRQVWFSWGEHGVRWERLGRLIQ